MPSVLDLVLATMLVAGGHEMGHQVEADRLDVPIKFNGIKWTTKAKGKDLARITEAGFEMQDLVVKARGKRVDSFVNAMHKVSYLADDRGDLAMIEKTRGKKARQVTEGALAMSAVNDLLIAFGKTKGNMRLSFRQTNKGTPTLSLGGSF